ncbi:MAG: hypothetical protein JXR91_09275 [Deltaproteobacteria bacterium]|nr:hypothetical protein [Deltaproteobacteria bacterium]
MRLLILIIPFLLISACQHIVFIDDGTLDSTDSSKNDSDSYFDSDTLTDTDNTTDSDSSTDSDSVTDTEPSCAPDGVTPLICDKFENGFNGEELNSGNASITTSSEFVYEGKKALTLETFAENQWASVSNNFTPVLTGALNFRFFVYIPEGGLTGRITLFNISGDGDPLLEETYGIDVNVSKTKNVEVYIFSNQVRSTSPDGIVPEGSWFCLHGTYLISSTAGAATVWIDDKLAVSTEASINTAIKNGASETHTGINWTEDGQIHTKIYIDNLLVSTDPVNCE